ncbi:MAG: YggS family pyridoxal phosphate-dependent enzyme, partial [Burkholderiaceae bacterium]
AQRDPDRQPLNVLLEVNVDGEASKSGVSPDQLHALARAVVGLPRLRLRGLMAVPEARGDPTEQRLPFSRLRVLAEQLRAEGLPCDQLSMGMSADLEAAIAEGATMIRVGTAIFGARSAAQDSAGILAPVPQPFQKEV